MRRLLDYLTADTRRACLLVFLAGLCLRLFQIGSKSIWVDEAYASGLMGMDPIQLVRMSVAGSPHPPLSFLFLRLSTMVFGHGEAGLRMLPALFSALAAVPLMLFTARRIGPGGALWTGLLWAASPFAVSLGQEGWIYGILSLIGFGLLDLADRAWRGSRTSLHLLVPVALAGVLMQHLFLLFVAAAFGLYFTLPREERIPWRRLAVVSVLFLLLYSPFFLLMLRQAAFRSQRFAGAGMDMSAVYSYRLFPKIPTVFARLIPGGILVEAGRNVLYDVKQLAFWVFYSTAGIIMMVLMFSSRKLSLSFRLWLAALLLVPLMLFIFEDPTVRHLTILWVPLGTAIAVTASRWKPAGPLLLLASVMLLFPYYNISSFPYHRSDWRGAVEFVEERIEEGDGVLVLGGQSGGLAWDFYSRGGSARFALGGEDPYNEHLIPGRSPESVLDSMLTFHSAVWIVNDIWGSAASELLNDTHCMETFRISPAMEVLRVSR